MSGNHQRPDIAKESERVRTVASSTTDRAVGGNAQAPTKKRKVFLNLFSVSLHSSNTFGPTDKLPEPFTLCATHHRSTSTPYFCVTASGWTTFPTDFDIFCPFSSSANPWTKTRLNGAVPRNATLVSRDVWNQAPYWSLPSTYKSATLSSPKTAAQEVPLSNQMSRMSVPLVTFSMGSSPRLDRTWSDSRTSSDISHQASAPLTLKSFPMWSMLSLSTSGRPSAA